MYVTEPDSDAALARRVRAGDADAFGALVERYMRRAYVQALGIVRSREDALDLSQEAFVRAYRARHTLDPERPFYAWLYQILRRLCFNFLRDAKARTRLMDADGHDWLVAATAKAAPADPATQAERAEERRRVAAAIDRLPPHEREVLVLKEFEELKYREIAEIQEYTKLMAESREQAIDRMVAAAMSRGANAVVNVRFSTSYVMSNASEIVVYGDAVILEPERA